MTRSLSIFIIALIAALGAAGAAPIAVGGWVETAAGAPLEGARVDLVPMISNFGWQSRVGEGRPPTPEPVATATSDGLGRYELAAPRPGLYRVLISAKDRVPMRYFPLALANAAELPPVGLLEDSGTELEVKGAGAAGIWVMAVSSDRRFWREAAANGWRVGLRLGQSDGDGRLRFPRAEGETLDLHAFVPSRLGPVSTFAAEATARLRLPASEGQGRGLVVRDAAGEPRAGLRVAAGELAWPVGATSESGRLELPGRQSGSVELFFFAEDFQRHSLDLPPASTDAEAEDFEVVWPRARFLQGRVIAGENRRPIVGAVVWPGHDPGAGVHTDHEGRYRLPVLAGERFWVEAAAPGFLSEIARVDDSDRRARRVPTLALTPAAQTVGRVVDAEGRPIAGTRLDAWMLKPTRHPPAFRPDRAASRAVSDEAGRFTLEGLLQGGRYEIHARREGFATVRTQLESAPPSEPLRLVLVPGRPAHGRVVDGEDRPLEGVAIEISEAGPAAAENLEVTTDGEGRFEIEALPAEELDLLARKDGFAPIRVRGIEVEPGTGPADLGTLVLTPGAAIRGRVEDRESEPLQGVSVWRVEDRGQTSLSPGGLLRRDPAAETDEAGRFLLDGLAEGQRYHLLFAREEYLPAPVMGVEAPYPGTIEVVLRPAARVSGRVVDELGEAVSGARVGLGEQDPPPGVVAPRSGQIPQATVTDGEGGFTFRGVAPGKIRLEARARGYQVSESLLLEVAEAEEIAELEIVLERGATVEGRVSNSRGEPVAGATLRVGPSRGESDPDGYYRLEGVAPGPAELELRHPAHARTVRALEIEPGTNVENVVLEAGFEVAGRVLASSGEAIEGARVELVNEAAWERRRLSATSDDEGHFRLEDVAEGRYRVAVAKAGWAEADPGRSLRVEDGPVEGVELRLEPAARVHGRLLGLDFDEISSVEVRAEAEKRPERAGQVDYEGHYEIRDLGPGVWHLRARLAGGRRQAEARVAIEPGMGELERDLRFGGGFTFTGRVVYGGEPLAGTRVSLSGFDSAAERSGTTDHLGGFRFEDLGAGRYRLSLNHPRELVSHNRYVDVEGDLDLEIELATARLSGRVIDGASGEPVAEAVVYAQVLLGEAGTDAGPLLAFGSGRDGAFSVPRLAAGRHRVRAEKDGYTPVEEIVDVAVGEVIEGLELELFPTAGLELVLRLAAGSVPETAVVGIYDDAGRLVLSEGRYGQADGRFRFSRVPPGTWRVAVVAPGGAPTSLRATVPSEPVEITLAPATRLEVRVPALLERNLNGTLQILGPDGRPFELVAPGGAIERAWPLVGGAGAVESVPPGVWTLRVESPGGEFWQAVVTLAGERRLEVSLP